MKRRVDAWPALSDLFAGLLVATFGGLMLFTGTSDPAEEEARKIRENVLASLQPRLGGDVRQQGGDVFLDVTLNFELNKDGIRGDDREKVGRSCEALRQVFEQHPEWRNEVEIWIEGHTDGSQPSKAATARDGYLYNWRLSGARAASVLHEFNACGVGPREHRIRAIGYADTKPIKACEDPHGVCPENRRTTFRIRPDRCLIEARLNKTDPGRCAAP